MRSRGHGLEPPVWPALYPKLDRPSNVPRSTQEDCKVGVAVLPANLKCRPTFPEPIAVSSDYEAGYAQFVRMVVEDSIEKLRARFESVCPDFAKEVFAVVGARI